MRYDIYQSQGLTVNHWTPDKVQSIIIHKLYCNQKQSIQQIYPLHASDSKKKQTLTTKGYHLDYYNNEI